MARTFRRKRLCSTWYPEDEAAQKRERKMALIWETLARAGVTPSLAAARMAAMDVHVTPQEAEIALAYAKKRNHLKLVFPS